MINKVKTMIYVYRVRKVVDWDTGKLAQRGRNYWSADPMEVGAIYMHLRDLRGPYKVEALVRAYDAEEDDFEYK